MNKHTTRRGGKTKAPASALPRRGILLTQATGCMIVLRRFTCEYLFRVPHSLRVVQRVRVRNLAMWNPLKNPLERRYGCGHLHFITCSCYQRRPLLGTPWRRDAFLRILDEVRKRYQFFLVGYVVMPEHIHVLISEPKTGTPSIVMQVLKQRVSRALHGNMSPRRSASQFGPCQTDLGEASPHLWERRFYDFNVWSKKKMIEKLHYMHMNPVKRGLVADPNSWAWSSCRFYQNGERGVCTPRAHPLHNSQRMRHPKIQNRPSGTSPCVVNPGGIA